MAKGKGGKANKWGAQAKSKAGQQQKEPSVDDEAHVQVSSAHGMSRTTGLPCVAFLPQHAACFT
jgi:hypothetical protein